MVFGIDLGTTNSLIGAGDILYTDLVSSNVDLERKKQVGRDMHGKSIISSYKTDMSIGESGELSRVCSSIVLDKLAMIAERVSGEDVCDVCISVPAYFATTQREAVKKAAEDAGLNLRRIVNEPTAAAICVCRHRKDFIIVYDLGGGTFDVTLIDARDGSYQTIATDGQILGGDDLDAELVNYVIKKAGIKMRYRTPENRAHLRSEVRLAKESIQNTGVDALVDIPYMGVLEPCKITVADYESIVEEVFAPTIQRTLAIIDQYVPAYEQPKIIYTGGSTYCPYLMKLLRSEITLEELTYDYPKDKLVAYGIAYIAKLVEEGKDTILISNVTKRLSIERDDGSSIILIENNTIIPCNTRYPLFNIREASSIKIRLYQGNNYMAKENDFIGEMEYDYGEVVPAHIGVVNVDIRVSYDGYVVVKAFGLAEDETQAREMKLQLR